MNLDEDIIDLLALPGWRLHPDGDLSRWAPRHVGIGCKMTWPEFCGYLSRGAAGDPVRYPDPELAKREHGGWTGGLFRENWRHQSAFVHTQVMTLDFDGHGDVDRVAEALRLFRCAIHSTYKSAPEAPRCRAVMLLSEPCADLREYKRAHVAMREALYRWGFIRTDKKGGIEGDIDEGASDATRLNYAPMHHPERPFAFRTTAGEPLEVSRIPPPPPRPIASAPRVDRERNPDKYREGALRRAEEEVRRALRGQRHVEFYRLVASLARPDLGLSDQDIVRALLPAFIDVAGEGRAVEGERTIRDAIAKGRGA